MAEERRTQSLWLFSVVCALSVALLHIAYVTLRLHVFREFTWTSRDIVWMAPVVYLGFFLLAALPAALFARLVRRPWGETVLAAFAVWLLLLLWQTLDPIARIVLALGSGVALGGIWHRAYRKSETMMRRGVGALAILSVAVAAGPAVVRWTSSRLARSESAPSDAPNVLLLILDTVRASSMSLYGYSRQTTPYLERIGREGVVFENAMATSSWSLPSHAGILTGLWSHELGGDYRRPVRGDLRTIVEAFRARGYATGGFSANMGFAGHESGFARGFDRFDDYQRNLAQLLLTATLSQTQAMQLATDNARAGYLRGILFAFKPGNLRLIGVRRSSRAVATDRTDRFLAWSAKVRPRPFFAFVNLMDAHAPYESPEPFRSAFGDGRREFDRYDGAISYLDSVVYGVLTELRRRGELDRTLVVITSDHGELFGEHGFDGHGSTLYLPALHVPLVMRFPGRIAAGTRVTRPVSLRDLPATLVDLTGIGGIVPFPGTTLRAAWAADLGQTPSPVFAEATRGVNVPRANQNYDGPIRSVLDSAAHYIRLANGREELYDWRADRDEMNNLAGKPERAGAVAQHRRSVDSLLTRSARAR